MKEKTSKEKKEYLDEHLCYELWMFFESYKKVKELLGEKGYFVNIFLETTLIHFRCLIEFYYYAKRYPTDTRAYEFVQDDRKWNAEKKDKNYIINDEEWNRLNQEIAHLTWNRIMGFTSEKDWWEMLSRGYPKIVEITDIFLSNLISKIKLKKVPELVDTMKKEI